MKYIVINIGFNFGHGSHSYEVLSIQDNQVLEDYYGHDDLLVIKQDGRNVGSTFGEIIEEFTNQEEARDLVRNLFSIELVRDS